VPRIRVLVVDDSVVVRRLVTEALSREPAIEVVGVAADGRIALAKVALLGPDVITMDVEMPHLDGIETVRALRASGHRQPVIMCSTLTERGAAATLDALAAGASDYVTKPSHVGSVQEAVDQVARDLVPRVLALVPRAARPLTRPGGDTPRAVPAQARPDAGDADPSGPRLAPAPPPHPVGIVVVGASTGGPEALSRLVGALPVLPVPVAVVQHMPPVFTTQLAARLDRLGAARVVEVEGPTAMLAGHVYVAPGGRHLEVRGVPGALQAVLTQEPPVNFCRPAVDVLLTSAAATAGAGVLAVVLTGMGADGRVGAEHVVGAGGTVVVQDEGTSVVWGMPGAVIAAGWAHRVLPIDDIADAVAAAVGAGAAVGGGR